MSDKKVLLSEKGLGAWSKLAFNKDAGSIIGTGLPHAAKYAPLIVSGLGLAGGALEGMAAKGDPISSRALAPVAGATGMLGGDLAGTVLGAGGGLGLGALAGAGIGGLIALATRTGFRSGVEIGAIYGGATGFAAGGIGGGVYGAGKGYSAALKATLPSYKKKAASAKKPGLHLLRKAKKSAKFTPKHDDNPRLKGGQKKLPDIVQEGILKKAGESRRNAILIKAALFSKSSK